MFFLYIEKSSHRAGEVNNDRHAAFIFAKVLWERAIGLATSNTEETKSGTASTKSRWRRSPPACCFAPKRANARSMHSRGRGAFRRPPTPIGMSPGRRPPRRTSLLIHPA